MIFPASEIDIYKGELLWLTIELYLSREGQDDPLELWERKKLLLSMDWRFQRDQKYLETVVLELAKSWKWGFLSVTNANREKRWISHGVLRADAVWLSGRKEREISVAHAWPNHTQGTWATTNEGRRSKWGVVWGWLKLLFLTAIREEQIYQECAEALLIVFAVCRAPSTQPRGRRPEKDWTLCQ